jgi:hypothetical protein
MYQLVQVHMSSYNQLCSVEQLDEGYELRGQE